MLGGSESERERNIKILMKRNLVVSRNDRRFTSIDGLNEGMYV